MPSAPRAAAAALAALLSLTAGCSSGQCQGMKQAGSPFAGLLCGGEGEAAPQPSPTLPSACQPRAVMPQFYALVDAHDPSLTGLHDAIAQLGAPVCLEPRDQSCQSDDQCQLGSCQNGQCPCVTSYSPLGNVLDVSLRAMATIATDPPEAPGLPAPGCLDALAAQHLPPQQRNRMCELRRALDVLLQQQGGQNLINDPGVKKVILTVLDYVEGKLDGRPHYDLFTGLGRMAGAGTASCDPAAPWQLLDNLLGYLTPQVAAQMLGHLQVLLDDPQMKQLLAQLSAGGSSAAGRDSVIVLANTLGPGIAAAASGQEALSTLNPLLDQIYNSSSFSDALKNEVRAVVADASALLAGGTGIFRPVQGVLRCAASPQVRCASSATCTDHDNELVGALYDILSRPEDAPGGSLDLATLVGALKTLATIDQTGQTGRTLRLIVQGVEGSPDPNDAHDARDAVAALAAEALTPAQGERLLPAVSTLIEKQVLTGFLSLLQDLLYTCKPPHD